MTPRYLLVAILLASCLVQSRAAAQTVSLDRIPSFAPMVSAGGGVVVWSRIDERSGMDPRFDRFHLMAYRDGAVTALPVAPRGVPFDVDVGIDAAGRVVAAYSRCRREPDGSEDFSGIDEYATGRGCDIYVYDFAAGREERVERVSSRASSEFLPSISGRRIAFARVSPARKGRGGFVPSLHVVALDGSERARTVPTGEVGYYERVRLGRRVLYSGGTGPYSLELEGRRLAFAWRYRVRRCPPTDGESTSFNPDSAAEIRLNEPGRRTWTVRRTKRCVVEGLVSPLFAGGDLVFFESLTGVPDAYLVRAPLAGGPLRRGPSPAPHIVSMAYDGQRLAYAHDAPGEGWEVALADWPSH